MSNTTCAIRYVFVMVLFTAALVSAGDSKSPSETQNVVEPERILTSLKYFVAGEERWLVLTREEVGCASAPSNSAARVLDSRLVYLRLRRLGLRTGENLGETEATVWQDFDCYWKGMAGGPTWHYALLRCPHDDRIYLCIVHRSADRRLASVRLFAIDATRATTMTFPMWDDNCSYKRPSVREQPIGEYTKEISPFLSKVIGVSGIEVKCEGGFFVATIKRDFGEGYKSLPFDVVFDLKTGKATEREIPPIPQ